MSNSNNSDNSDWNSDHEELLESIRYNCAILNEQHKKQYFYFKSFSKYFRAPLLLLSGINSVASIGLSNYILQKNVSLICCLISLVTGIITSVELYLGIESSMANELEASREFYLLSIDIYKTLKLNRNNRSVEGGAYLESCLAKYSKLFESSNVLTKNIKDKLVNIDLDNSLKSSSDEIENELNKERSGGCIIDLI
jgi:hypothetical protein